MPAKRTIWIRTFVEDVRSGLTDAELMEKHRVSEKELRLAFRKLVASHVLDPAELPSVHPDQFEETMVLDV
jgi:hypothetical protein